jgi:FkbM family methyltransferase
MIVKEKLIMFPTFDKLRFVQLLAKVLLFLRSLIKLSPTNVRVKRKGIYWSLDLNEAIDFCLYVAGDYEPELIDAYRPIIKDKDMLIIDIGANIGAHTLNFAKYSGKNARIIAIEPTNYAYSKLVNNVHRNDHLKNKVHCYKVLLTNPEHQVGVDKISASWDIQKGLNCLTRNQFDGGFACNIGNAPKRTLDEFIEENNIEQVDMIKLDVDGNEVDILQGARLTFEKFRPILIVELSPIHFDNSSQPHTFAEQVEELKKLEYEFTDIFGKKVELDCEKLLNWIPHGTLVNIIGNPK